MEYVNFSFLKPRIIPDILMRLLSVTRKNGGIFFVLAEYEYECKTDSDMVEEFLPFFLLEDK